MPANLLLAIVLLLAAASPAAGQDKPPVISQRSFTSGSIKATVTGSVTIDAEIPINDKASYADGGMTWLQFGNSGAAEPNVLITYGETGETGIGIGKGKASATGGIMPGEESECSGKVTVTATEVAGGYTCKGVTSYEPGKGMGKVDIKVEFTAKS